MTIDASDIVMRWFRTNRRFAGTLALFALALQFTLAFGHIHLRDFAGVPGVAVAQAQATTTDPADRPQPRPFRRRLLSDLRHRKPGGHPGASEPGCARTADLIDRHFLRSFLRGALRPHGSRAISRARTSFRLTNRSSRSHRRDFVTVDAVRKPCQSASPRLVMNPSIDVDAHRRRRMKAFGEKDAYRRPCRTAAQRFRAREHGRQQLVPCSNRAA